MKLLITIFVTIYQTYGSAYRVKKINKKINTTYAVNVNIYLESHLPHKYGCENVIGHGKEKPLLQKEEEKGERKRKRKKENFKGKRREKSWNVVNAVRITACGQTKITNN